MKKRWALAVSALAVTLMAGCSPAGGTAATVNGIPIRDSLVSSWAEGCAQALSNHPTLAQSAGSLRPQMAKWAILDQMSSQYIEQSGGAIVTPSESELRDYVTQRGLGDLFSNEQCAQAAYGIARHDRLALSLGASASQYLTAFNVELNPRYGTWDPSVLGIIPSGSLSQPLSAK